MNYKCTVYKNRLIGTLGLIISIIIIINFPNIIGLLTDFSEKYLSRDNNINIKSIVMIKIITIIGITAILTLSVLFILNVIKKLYPLIFSFFQINNPLTSNICRIKQLDLYILIIGTVLGLFQIYYHLTFGEPIGDLSKPGSEGILEKIYSIFLLFSALLLIFSITRIEINLIQHRTRKKIIFSLIAISVVLLLIFGEEISWGQRILGWESTGVFTEYNYQNETNVHNFFNPILIKYIYPLVGLCSFMVLFLVWIFPDKRKSYYFNLFFPHPSLFLLVLIMTFSSFIGGGGETYEQLFAVFVLLYSFRIFMCLNFPNVDLLSKETRI